MRIPIFKRVFAVLGAFVSVSVAVTAIGGVAAVALKTGGSMPAFSRLAGEPKVDADIWCESHGVAESICVECRKELRPARPEYGWCKEHGVHLCVLHHPDVAQLTTIRTATADDFERAKRALAHAPRVENNPKCKHPQRLIQFASAEEFARLGIALAPVTVSSISEMIVANGWLDFNTSRVARVSPKTSGTVRSVARKVGDAVKTDDELARVESPEIGKLSAEAAIAKLRVEIAEAALASLRSESAGVAPKALALAEATLEEARVVRATAIAFLRSRGLGPDESGADRTIAIRSPRDGIVTECHVATGELADPARTQFVVIDTSVMWLTLHVALEDVSKVLPGQPVRFGEGNGTVNWVSPVADSRTGTVPVRVALTNAIGSARAYTIGRAEIEIRHEPRATVVPSDAVHWEGDCHVVFVRDRTFDGPDSPKLFHVRSVRPGATANGMTEIIVGLLPGEVVATRGSGMLRGELLKAAMGDGCGCGH